MPQKGRPFLNRREQIRLRLRARRNRVLAILGQGIAGTGVVGLFPPFRELWWATIVFAALLGAYLLALGVVTVGRLPMFKDRTLKLPEAEENTGVRVIRLDDAEREPASR